MWGTECISVAWLTAVNIAVVFFIAILMAKLPMLTRHCILTYKKIFWEILYWLENPAVFDKFIIACLWICIFVKCFENINIWKWRKKPEYHSSCASTGKWCVHKFLLSRNLRNEKLDLAECFQNPGGLTEEFPGFCGEWGSLCAALELWICDLFFFCFFSFFPPSFFLPPPVLFFKLLWTGTIEVKKVIPKCIA